MQAVKSKLNALHAKHQEALLAAEQAEAELAEIIAKAEELEALTEEKNGDLQTIEDDLDGAESKLQGMTEEFGTTEKSTEEHRQARVQLENRNSNDSKLIQDLEEELSQIQAENDVIVEKLNEKESALLESEEQLDNEDERKETADARVKQLEADVILAGNSLRSMEICEKEGVERVSSGDNKLVEMENKYKDKDSEAGEAEAKAEELEKESDAKDEELVQARVNYDATKVEFDSLIHEINEI